jgi:23S rRNA pseudouridine2605 synthase
LHFALISPIEHVMPRSSKRHDRKPRHGGPKSRTGVKKPWKPRRTSSRGAEPAFGEAVRLQKVLASAGVGSRRQCEELIREGRVDVDGQTVTEMGTRVNPDSQQIRVDGEALRRPKKQYFLVNKPSGILSTSRDPSGRPRVIDLAPSNERLFTVGRLDKSSEGLVVVTNDGQLTDLLTHPRYGVEKIYLAQVAGVPTAETIAKLRRGVQLSEGFAHAKRVYVRRRLRQSAILEIVLDEGRNREVRRLLARVGHKVMKLRRTALGPLRLADLKPGESRPLRREEVEELYRTAQEGRRKKAKERHERREPNLLKSRPLKPTEQTSAVHPIIDKSLPPEALSDEDEIDLIAGEASLDDLGAMNLPGGDFDDEQLGELSDEPDFTEEDIADDEGAAPVDLRPFVRGKSRGPQQPTIIGGDQRRKPKARGRRPQNRGKDRPQRTDRKPNDRGPIDRAAGRKRGRRT